MWMDLVIVLDPSGDLPEGGFTIRQWVDANIVALEGFDEGLGNAIRLQCGELLLLREEKIGANWSRST